MLQNLSPDAWRGLAGVCSCRVGKRTLFAHNAECYSGFVKAACWAAKLKGTCMFNALQWLFITAETEHIRFMFSTMFISLVISPHCIVITTAASASGETRIKRSSSNFVRDCLSVLLLLYLHLLPCANNKHKSDVIRPWTVLTSTLCLLIRFRVYKHHAHGHVLHNTRPSSQDIRVKVIGTIITQQRLY